MTPQDAYELLNFIQAGLYWSFLTFFPVVIILVGGILNWLVRSFFKKFEKRYALTDVMPININVFARGKKYKGEVTYSKMCILNDLARCYLKPYVSGKKRHKNILRIEKYKAIADPYFLACYKILEKKAGSKKAEENLDGKTSDAIEIFYKKDLAKFLLHDQCELVGKLGFFLIIIAFYSYKWLIPALKNHYVSLMGGY